MQFKAAWGKHKDDPNLTNLESSLSRKDTATVRIMLFVAAHEVMNNNCSVVGSIESPKRAY